jgi:hypothetical protein
MARTVAVTGGSGKLDCAVVAALIEDGWAVVNFDRVSSDSRARLIRTHLTDYGQVVEAISGIDEVHRSVDARRSFGRHSGRDLRHVPPKFECDIAERRIDISPRSVTQATPAPPRRDAVAPGPTGPLTFASATPRRYHAKQVEDGDTPHATEGPPAAGNRGLGA